ncbi:hypothetical protein F5Y05DRAFT_377248 [Hypoxylon sp. FL0543]|nr:hypothetical protein F5Y05DRAFT_377248 [Hypoxylon sp. FL0543]
MDWGEYILKRCQFEECEATILLRGPYCTKHSPCKSLPKLASIAMPSCATGIMAPQEEKLGDAITVKTPLAPLGHTSEKSEKNEKRRLSDKKTARKTTSSGSFRPKPVPAMPRNLDSRPSPDRVPLGDNVPSGQRPLKRPRLNTDVDKEERRPRYHSPSAESVPYTSMGSKPAAAERDDLGSAAASNFALRPQKGNSAFMEVPPPQPKSREDRVPSTSKPSQTDQPYRRQVPSSLTRNHGFPTHAVIDLTMDDDPVPQFSKKERQNLHSNTQNDPDNRATDSRAPVNPKLSDRRTEGNSIEVQITQDRGADKPANPVDTSNRNEKNHVRRKTSSNLPARQPPKKAHVAIAPRTEPTLVPPNYFDVQGRHPLKFVDDNQITPQNPPQPQPPAEKHMDLSHKNGVQARATGHVRGSAEELRTLSLAAVSHVPTAPPAADHLPTGPVTGPTATPRTESANGDFIASRFTLSAQVEEYVRSINEKHKVDNRPTVNGSAHNSRATHSGIPVSQRESGQLDSSIRSSQSRELASLKQTSVDPQGVNSHTPSPQREHVTQRASQPPVASFEECLGIFNGIVRQANNTANGPTHESETRSPGWRRLELEKKRQALISKHDPVKFDSYIYGKNNEPFRPGSALFGLPPKLQPPRPTIPATHFAYIDPRIHWTFPRPEKWHRQKQKEILERGTRKSNFGQAAARAAKRKRTQRDTGVEYPERVKNNPQWMAAMDELEEMAEEYHAQKREEYKNQKEREEHLKKRLQKCKEGQTVILDGCEDEEVRDASGTNHSNTMDDRTWFFIRRA